MLQVACEKYFPINTYITFENCFSFWGAVSFLKPSGNLILSCLSFHEDARRQARKAFLALSDSAGLHTASSKLDEEDAEDLPDPLADDDNQFSKSTPVRFSAFFEINLIQWLHFAQP